MERTDTAGADPSSLRSPGDDERLFPVVTRLFVLFIALEVVGACLPGLPLVLALVATRATRIRHARWRTVVLWAVAALVTLMVVAPFVVAATGITFSTETAPHRAGPS